MIIEVTPPPVHSRLERHWLRWRAVVVTTFPDGVSVSKWSEWYFRKAVAELEREYLAQEGQSWIRIMTPIMLDKIKRNMEDFA